MTCRVVIARTPKGRPIRCGQPLPCPEHTERDEQPQPQDRPTSQKDGS